MPTQTQPDASGGFLDGQGVGGSRPHLRCTPSSPAASCAIDRWTGAGLRSSPRRLVTGYCLAMAMRSRSSGLMKWSWSSLPRSIWTQWILPVNRLSLAV